MSDSPAYNQIFSLCRQGRYREAAPKMGALVQQFPQRASYWHLYSVIALNLRQPGRAVDFSKKATELDSGNPDFQVQLANSLHRRMNIAEALAEAAKVEAMNGQSAATWDVLGTLYTGCGNVEKAQQMYEKAVALDPNTMHFQFNLATALRGNGKLEEAEAIYDRVIANNPGDYEAYANRSQLRTQTEEKNHVDQLKGLLDRGIKQWRDEVQICYALAKECEDIKDYPESFARLARGASLRRRHSRYQVEGDLDAIDKIIATFSKGVVDSCAGGCESEEPIFILGLPRSGTTLVERIVDSHSEVNSLGELQNFAAEMIKLVAQQCSGEKPGGEKLDKLGMIERSVSIDVATLGQSYIDGTRPASGKVPHFIDKLPLNYLYIGLIAMALPKAKIIHLTRHPMDACYAIYKTLFKEAYPFSYDLEDMGRYYLAYHKLMEHWRQVLPNRILDVSYETLVQNQEAESRRIIEYCGLAWEHQCLQFHKNPQASMTASAAQVRQPIYASSVQKWRHYEEQLQPLRELLVAGGLSV